MSTSHSPARFSLKGHGALVTGSSRGIGHALGLGLVEAGAEVVFHGTQPRPREIPPDCPYVTGDLRSSTAPRELIRAASKRLTRLNLLVCNAGAVFDVPFLEMTAARWKHTFELNVSANYFLIQEFTRHLLEQEMEGAVVVVAGTNGLHPGFDNTAHDIAKGSQLILVKSLAAALGEHGIRVNAIAPGVIDTLMTRAHWQAQPTLKARQERKILLGRAGVPEDCVGATVFLCSPAARYITGQVLPVDGGYTVGPLPRE